MAEIPSDERCVIIFERVYIAVWKLGLIGLLLVFTYIPCSFIYLFIYLLVSRLFSLLFFNFYFAYLSFPFPSLTVYFTLFSMHPFRYLIML